MNFQAYYVGNLQGFLQQCTDIFEMGKQSLGILIPLAAMGSVAVKAEPIIETFSFFICFFNKLIAEGMKIVQLSLIYLEIGNNCATFVLCCYNFLLFRFEFPVASAGDEF